MRRILIILCFLLCQSLSAQTELKILSMNIKEGAKFADHKAAPYAEIILEEKPDFVALQEVDYCTVRNGGIDWLNDLAQATGMMPYYCKSFDYQGGGYGVAILSKYPFYKAEKIVSVIEGAKEPRATGWVYVCLQSGQIVRVGSTHLALESAEITTKNMADVNKKIFAEDTTTPTLLIGDYNAAPDSDPIEYFKLKWSCVSSGIGNTIPSDKPTRCLDYIMGYPKAVWTMKSHKILARPDLSDHCFIVATVSL